MSTRINLFDSPSKVEPGYSVGSCHNCWWYHWSERFSDVTSLDRIPVDVRVLKRADTYVCDISMPCAEGRSQTSSIRHVPDLRVYTVYILVGEGVQLLLGLLHGFGHCVHHLCSVPIVV